MYNASTSFHTAVIDEENLQQPLVVFKDLFFDNDDITEDGIAFTDNFNLDEELEIGTTPSNQISFSVINENNLISYDFGEFKALLGVYVGTESIGSNADLFVQANPTTKIEVTSNTITSNGVNLATQPTDTVVALFCYENALYAIYEDGSAIKYTYSNGTWTQDFTYATNDYMVAKWSEWAGRCVSFYNNKLYEYTKNDNTITTWSALSADTWEDLEDSVWGDFDNWTVEVFEYVPLGVFYPENSHFTNDVQLTITGNDKMASLEINADVWWNSLSPGVNARNIINALCTRYGLTLNLNSPFLNPYKFFQNLPISENKTVRDILGEFALLFGTVARFNRDGELEFAWFKTNNIDIPWEFEQSVYNYNVQPINKLTIGGITVGSGANEYYVSENWLGINLSNATNIYNRLAAFSAFPPSNAGITSDWSICSGDVLTIENTLTPVYVQSITWAGVGMATIENTGEETRPIDDLSDRQLENISNTVSNLENTTAILSEAIESSTVVFDTSGETINNAALRILDASANVAVYADKNGIATTGNFTSNLLEENIIDTVTQWNNYTCDIDAVGVVFKSFISDSDGQQLSAYVTKGGIFWEDRNNTSDLTVSADVVITDKLISASEDAETGVAAVWIADGSGSYYLARSSSSKRYKKNIEPLAFTRNATKIIDCMRPIIYEDKISDNGTKYLGFIAEELDEICKPLVFYDRQGRPDAVAYDRITVLLVEDNKKMHKKIDELEKRVLQLEKRK